jgi:hypothetical protein
VSITVHKNNILKRIPVDFTSLLTLLPRLQRACNSILVRSQRIPLLQILTVSLAQATATAKGMCSFPTLFSVTL